MYNRCTALEQCTALFLFFQRKMNDFLSMIAALLIAITVHEFSHAFVAHKLGDPTAKYAGRLSLNPVRHLDFFGTLFLFIAGIGWGKPVPVNPHNFRFPRRDEALVSLAGPASNFLVAVLVAIPLRYVQLSADPTLLFLWHFLGTILEFNIFLAVFNLLPFPPLDGSKLWGMVIPHKWQYAYDRFQHDGMQYFILFLLFDSVFMPRIIGFSLISFGVNAVATLLKALIFFGT